VRDAADLADTMSAVIAATAKGVISPDEGSRLARLIEIFLRAVDVRDFERRLQLLENSPRFAASADPDYAAVFGGAGGR
jgi:hypothetical protein